MTTSLPAATATINAHQQSIQEMIDDGQTDAQIIATLFRYGVQTSERSLRRRLQFWGLRRPPNGPGADLVEAVNYIFHHTTLNDAKIAEQIYEDYDLQIITGQVRSIRSRFGWVGASTGAKKAAQLATTQQLVEQEILNGPAYTYGRR
jgi:hypothetical protein